MKIAVLGANGYIGSILSDMLLRQNIDNVIDLYDYNIYGYDLLFDNIKEINIIEDYDKIIKQKYDIIYWLCDIDCNEFYNLSISEKYLELSYNAFERISKNSNVIIYPIYSFNKINEVYKNYINKIQAFTNVIFIDTPLLYGSSLRMRFDLKLHSMFLQAYLEKVIVIENMFECVTSMNVVKFCEILLSYKEYNLDDYITCLSESAYALIIKKIFNNEIDIINITDVENPLNKVEGELTYCKDKNYSFSNTMKFLKNEMDKYKESFEFLKDKYSNDKVIQSYKYTNRFFTLMNKLER